MKIPQLKKKSEIKTCHNSSWEDNYSWIHQNDILEVLKDSKKLNPEVRKYLEEENSYTDFHLSNTKDIQKELVQHSWNQQQILQASHLLIICIDTKLNESDVEKYFERVKEIRNTPDEIINSFREYLKTTIAGKTKEDLLSWGKNQAYLALGNLLTVCANEKIDSCPMEGFIPEKYDEILGLKEKKLSSVLVLPVGYRANDDIMIHQKKVRKNVEEIVIDIS